jgi:hypothetical protein
METPSARRSPNHLGKIAPTPSRQTEA